MVTLDIETGTDEIRVYEGDNLSIIAKKFCIKHNLDEECIDFLVKNITK